MNDRLTGILLFSIGISMLAACQDKADKEIVFSLPAKPVTVEGHISQGTCVSPAGGTLSLNSLCYTKDGEPWYPVMGEMHYSRVPGESWDEEVLKMKASGVTVIATYVFWNHHEETEGKFVWSGDRDLRRFLQVCASHGMYVWLRIGPWCHGEARYGGFPDWLVNVEGGLRKENPKYLDYVKRFFGEIGKQTAGLRFKEGGPIIGVQIENEYGFADEAGLTHILHVKQLAVEAGLDVPYYTATGWPKSDLSQTELIPVWGGYPEAPWDARVTELPLSANYVFNALTNDPSIGSDLLGEQENATAWALQYPYSTAEMGGGNQVTYHRRPIITAEDVVAQSYVKVGSGANLMGYYMYHGGHNPMGERTTLQESRATGYPNDYTILNYDFFAPIGQWGQLRDSYNGFKVLHAFLNDYGTHLATTVPTFLDGEAPAPEDDKTPRLCVRSDGEGGYLFVNDYQRLLEMEPQQGLRIRIKRQDGTETAFPKLDVASGEQLIFPFNIDLNGHRLLYATAQPLYVLHNDTPTYVFFVQHRTGELAFTTDGTTAVSLDDKPVTEKDGIYTALCTPDKEHLIRLSGADGTTTDVLVLTGEQALHGWKLHQGDKELLAISSAGLTETDGTVTLRHVDNPSFELLTYPAGVQWQTADGKGQNEVQGLFNKVSVTLPGVSLQAGCQVETRPEAYVWATPRFPEDDRKADAPASCPGPQYFVNFRPVATSLYYRITTPALPEGISNAYLAVDYTGDTASMYLDGGLVADDYYTGEPMLFKLDGKNGGNEGKYLLQVIPFAPEVEVYLSPAARRKLEAAAQGVSDVRVLPVYETKLTISE